MCFYLQQKKATVVHRDSTRKYSSASISVKPQHYHCAAVQNHPQLFSYEKIISPPLTQASYIPFNSELRRSARDMIDNIRLLTRKSGASSRGPTMTELIEWTTSVTADLLSDSFSFGRGIRRTAYFLFQPEGRPFHCQADPQHDLGTILKTLFESFRWLKLPPGGTQTHDRNFLL